MKVLHVIGGMNASSGGPPVVVDGLVTAQRSLGLEVHILTHPPISSNAIHPEGIQVHEFPPSRGWKKIQDVFFHRNLYDGLVASMDVLHLHGVWEPLLLQASGSCHITEKPYIVTLHGMLDPWPMSHKKLKKHLFLRLAYRKMLDRASCLALYEHEIESVRLLGIKNECRVICNGVSKKTIESLPKQACFRARHPSIGDAPVLLFLGRLHFVKGLDYLADIFGIVAQKNPKVVLVVAGPDGGYKAEFERRIAALGLSSRVLMTGPLYGQDKFEALVDADCFVLPSRQEGFSMAITEALACGLPAIVSQESHFAQVASAGAGHVLPLKPQAFADAILKILSDPKTRQTMGHAGRKLVLEKYTWESIAQTTKNIYEHVVEKSPSGSRRQ